MGTPLLIHQPSYSMLNRWIEGGLLDVLGREGVGCIAFSPLAQGVLTGKYLNGIPAGSRATQRTARSTDQLSEQTLAHIRSLNKIARRAGSPWPSSRWPGRCGTSGSPRSSSARAAWPSSRRTSPR